MAECAVDNENLRLAALYEYDVLDSEPEESFDRITRLVKITLGTPISVVSLVDRDRQWYKSRQGIGIVETARDISFCTHTIRNDEPLIVPDATKDARFRDSPLVTAENGIRFYLGVPLRTPSGFNIGSLCAMDTKPRQVSVEQIAVMHDLARLVVDELELRKLAAIDGLTGALMSRAFALEARKEVSKARRSGRDIGCIVFDLDHFKTVNDRFGHAAGDHVLRTVAVTCQGELRAGDALGRIGGEEFVVMLPDTPFEGTLETAERLRARIAATPILYAGVSIRITASLGVAMLDKADADFTDTLKRADTALYKAKDQGRNCAVVADVDSGAAAETGSTGAADRGRGPKRGALNAA